MEITKKELQIFRAITFTNPETISELAQTTSTSLSYTSTTLKKLEKKGFITQQRKNREKKPRIADTLHASTLRTLILDTPHLNHDILANKGTTILTTITCQNLRTTEELLEASNVSYRTLWSYMDTVRGMGIIQKNETITITPRHEKITQFIEAYQQYIHQTEATKIADDALIKWGCQDTYIFETTKTLSLQPTGISAFKDYGALFLTPRNLYTNTQEKLRLEDHIINHVLAEGKQNTLPLLITWMLNKDDIDTEYLNKKAYRLKASTVTDAAQTYIQTKGKEKPEYLLNWTELTEKLREYSNE